VNILHNLISLDINIDMHGAMCPGQVPGYPPAIDAIVGMHVSLQMGKSYFKQPQYITLMILNREARMSTFLRSEICIFSFSGSTYGMEFILGLPPTIQDAQYTIHIGAPLENVGYVVETLIELISSGTVTPEGVAMVSPNISLQVTSGENIEQMKGIRVRATRMQSLCVN
jgi:hypothetical protein